MQLSWIVGRSLRRAQFWLMQTATARLKPLSCRPRRPFQAALSVSVRRLVFRWRATSSAMFPAQRPTRTRPPKMVWRLSRTQLRSKSWKARGAARFISLSGILPQTRPRRLICQIRTTAIQRSGGAWTSQRLARRRPRVWSTPRSTRPGTFRSRPRQSRTLMQGLSLAPRLLQVALSVSRCPVPVCRW